MEDTIKNSKVRNRPFHMAENVVGVDILTVLQFFDEKATGSQYHATAVVAVAGEEMGLGLVMDCLRRQGWTVEDLGPCTQGTQKGARLDRWIRASRDREITYYQTEVKNWSAHAIGGKILKVDVLPDMLSKHNKIGWGKVWNGLTLRKGSDKVLIPMKLPCALEKTGKIKPLICYWDAVHPKGKPESMFSVKLSQPPHKFPRLWVFSMSTYLRELRSQGISKIDLEMPNTVKRVQWLNRLFKLP